MAYDQTLVQVRERSFLDILDLTLVVVRRRPLAIALAALVGAAPFAAFNAWLMADGDTYFATYLFLLAMESPWATAPLTIVLGGLMFGERPSAGRTLRSMAQSFGSMVLFQGLLRGFLLITLVLIVLLPTRMNFMNEVILLERGRWWPAFRRCSSLCQARGGELIGQWLAQLFFGTMFVFAFWAGSLALSKALFSNELTWEATWSDLVGPRFHLAVWVALEFFAIARFFSYIDQRIRLEGWEVELRVRSVGRAMEDARRW